MGCSIQVLYAITKGRPKSRAQATAAAFWIATMLVPSVHHPLPVATITSGEWRADCSTGQMRSCS